MKAGLVKYNYGQDEIEFELTGRKKVMVNATLMAKIYKKEVTHFLENDSTKKFISACLKTRNSEFLGIKTREDLVYGKQKSGTWMHRVLALKFAAWLNPDFELWVYSTIDKILSGYGNKLETSIKKTVELKDELRKIESTLKSENEDFARYLEIMRLLQTEKVIRGKATKNKFQYELDLFGEQ